MSEVEQQESAGIQIHLTDRAAEEIRKFIAENESKLKTKT